MVCDTYSVQISDAPIPGGVILSYSEQSIVLE